MIIVKLKGGLGNQMFQYAFAEALSRRRKVPFKLDRSHLDLSPWQKFIGITVRHYELGKFINKINFANVGEMMITKRIKEIPFNSKGNLRKIDNTKGNLYLDGYWQSEKYFKDIQKVIHKDFRLKNKSNDFVKIKKIILSKPNSVSIHIRRGDYAKVKKTNKFHGLLNFNYYRKSVDLIAEKVKNPHFFVFSDDPIWVEKNFMVKYPATHVSGLYKLTDAEELILMSLCRHNIIANSSFSWWGAWLNRNPKKVVVAPRRWLRAKIEYEDLFPIGWFKI